MKRKQIDLDTVKKVIDALNKLLAADIAQEHKRPITTIAESLLMAIDAYDGFNYLYWLDKGCDDWREAGEPEDFHEKDKFIVGDGGGASHGEYSRFYYLGKLLRMIKGE